MTGMTMMMNTVERVRARKEAAEALAQRRVAHLAGVPGMAALVQSQAGLVPKR
jgi:hypothetical protein